MCSAWVVQQVFAGAADLALPCLLKAMWPQKDFQHALWQELDSVRNLHTLHTAAALSACSTNLNLM